jgi:hypothetical protein
MTCHDCVPLFSRVDMSERRTIPDKVTLLERELDPISHLIKRGPLSAALTSASFLGRNLGSTSGETPGCQDASSHRIPD